MSINDEIGGGGQGHSGAGRRQGAGDDQVAVGFREREYGPGRRRSDGDPQRLARHVSVYGYDVLFD